jgi:heme exporter protein C
MTRSIMIMKLLTFAASINMKFIYQSWWKVLTVIVIFYTLIAGMLIGVPKLPIVHETIRNTYFHVPMWMAMFTVFTVSVFIASNI